jgi:predicted ATPase/class 3 adenylate cyclase
MRVDLPTGTVTFVFTDIAGSTKLLLELGEERYAQALAGHRETLRAAFARYDGVEVGTEGDSFFVAFRTARQALDAISEGLEALRGGMIQVRVGIHTGTPLLTAEGYVGTDIHRASRIASAGHGGQVLVSGTTAALVDADRFDLVDLGEHQLKDLERSERIFQYGSGAFPPIRSFSPSNLPTPTTVFLGRQDELERVKGLIVDPDVRLLTLTGPGGIGKTRLALQAAFESSARFPDGRWWVPLGPLSDHRFALSALATAVGVEEVRDGSLASDLVSRLGAGRSLVLLDNAEHLLPSLTAELAPVVDGVEGVTFLVTSRAPLHLEAEYEYPVPTMSSDDASAFFLSRARASGIGVEPSTALTRLCERLDHLPLAMQLAAPRLKVLSVEQLTDTLSHALDLEGQRDTDPRHRTLRATIEWSHSLLVPPEQEAFRRLSVFAGGATADAIEDVTGADLDTLFALLDRSLVRRRDGAAGPRFWMLETIREFALERLAEADESLGTRGRHARFYRSLAVRAGIALDGHRGRWLEILDEELENLRTTLSWFLEAADHEGAQEVAGSLAVYWLDRGLLSELRSWLERSLEVEGHRGQAYVTAVSRLSTVAYLQGDYERARTAAEEALPAARALGDPAGIQLALANLANAREADGALDEASALEEEGLRIARDLRAERPRRLLVALINLGYTDVVRGRSEDAVRHLEEAIAVAHELGESVDAAAARCNLAMASLDLGRIDEAARLAAEATVAAIGASDRLLATDCLEVLAAVEAERGHHGSAARLLGTSEAARHALGYEMQPAERALHERTMGRIRGVMDESELADAWARGTEMDVEQAFASIGPEILT